MKTAPDNCNKFELKVIFEKPEGRANSLQEIEYEKIDIKIINDSIMKNSIYKSKKTSMKSRLSSISLRKLSNVFHIFKNLKIPKINKINLFIKEILLPYFLSSLIIISILYSYNTNINGYCFETSYGYIYITVIFGLFVIFYYILLIYYILFAFIVQKIEKDKKIVIFLIFFIGLLIGIPLSLLKTLKINPLKFDLDIHAINFFVAIIIATILCHKYKISKNEIKPYFLINFALVISLAINHFLLKNYLFIYLFYLCHQFQNGIILFQTIIFIYFQIFGKFFYYLIIRFLKLNLDIENHDSILFFLKYFLIEAFCSSATFPILSQITKIETFYLIITFSYQLLTFFTKENYFYLLIMKFINFMKSKSDIKKKGNEIEHKLKSLLAGSTNEILIIIYIRFLTLFFFNKILYASWGSNITDLIIDCSFNLNSKIEIHLENFIILLMIHFCLFGYILLNSMDNQDKLILWKLESYHVLFKTHYICMLFFVVDLNLQFYFNLYLIKN